MPVRVLACSLQEVHLPFLLAAGIERVGKRRLDGRLLGSGMRGRAEAYGVGRAGVDKTGNAHLCHKLNQPMAQEAIDGFVVVEVEQGHVCSASTIDDGIAALGCTEQVFITQQGALKEGEPLGGGAQMYCRCIAYKGVNSMALIKESVQHIVSQQSAATQKQDGHIILHCSRE